MYRESQRAVPTARDFGSGALSTKSAIRVREWSMLRGSESGMTVAWTPLASRFGTEFDSYLSKDLPSTVADELLDHENVSTHRWQHGDLMMRAQFRQVALLRVGGYASEASVEAGISACDVRFRRAKCQPAFRILIGSCGAIEHVKTNAEPSAQWRSLDGDPSPHRPRHHRLVPSDERQAR